MTTRMNWTFQMSNAEFLVKTEDIIKAMEHLADAMKAADVPEAKQRLAVSLENIARILAERGNVIVCTEPPN